MSDTTILIVDDDLELRRELSDTLQANGFDCREAASCEEAMRQAQETPFDLILMDFLLPDPDMDGIDAIREIRKRDKRVKFIMITAFGTIDNAVSAMKKGASEYISKPFKVQGLLAVIQRTLAEARFERRLDTEEVQPLFHSLSNPIRRGIIDALGDQSGGVRLMDLARAVGVQDHTKVMFHLRTLKKAGIIHQKGDRSYELTEQGRSVRTHLHAMRVIS